MLGLHRSPAKFPIYDPCSSDSSKYFVTCSRNGRPMFESGICMLDPKSRRLRSASSGFQAWDSWWLEKSWHGEISTRQTKHQAQTRRKTPTGSMLGVCVGCSLGFSFEAFRAHG